MKGLFKATAVASLTLVGMFASVAGASATEVDFSTHGEGQFDQRFYEQNGVVFTVGSFVGYVQGDQALVGPIAGKLKPKVTSLSARIAPAAQGTATYTLTALRSNGGVIKSTSVTVTQDMGDPKTGPWGYVTIELGKLPKKASRFTLANEFVRSSYSHITQIEFGVASIAYSK